MTSLLLQKLGKEVPISNLEGTIGYQAQNWDYYLLSCLSVNLYVMFIG